MGSVLLKVLFLALCFEFGADSGTREEQNKSSKNKNSRQNNDRARKHQVIQNMERHARSKSSEGIQNQPDDLMLC